MNFEKQKGGIFNIPNTTLSLVVEGNHGYETPGQALDPSSAAEQRGIIPSGFAGIVRLTIFPALRLKKLSLTNKAIVKNTGAFPAVSVNINSQGSADKFTASDNFFWLEAGETTEVNVNLIKSLTIDAWNLN